jgi:3-hydroxyisobutyrate dehydrogenase-like beta-hydroxyacid dehydrogenase
MTSVGVLGYGEAGQAFASELARNGVSVRAYDTAWQASSVSDTPRHHAREGVRFCSLSELIAASELVLSTVTTDAALAAATACVPQMLQHQTYCDFNSTEPKVKVAIDEVCRKNKVSFVEGAILGAIGVTGTRTQILLAGAQAHALSTTLNAVGLNTSFYSVDIGKASMFKMLRSIFSKDVEAVLIEFLLAARKAGLEQDLWKEVTTLFNENTFENVARNWVLSHATAHARRHHEMLQVLRVVQDLGLEPIMTSATTQLFERSCGVRLADAFRSKPQDLSDAIRELLARISAHQVQS